MKAGTPGTRWGLWDCTSCLGGDGLCELKGFVFPSGESKLGIVSELLWSSWKIGLGVGNQDSGHR